MKTHNLWIFVLAAFFCGALFCTQASAKVCFVGDSECGSGAEFGAIEPLPNQELCAQEGYTVLAGLCVNPGGTCPYDARYVKCCPMSYAYQSCIFPLEPVKKVVDGKLVVDKCGSLYRCQCPAEYGVSSNYAKTNNCQPGGGYCMVNDGTTDQVKYKTCSCDTSVYTDAKRCSNNQSEEASCRNEKGEVRKKCYCDRTRFPYAACEYGSKGTICIDSNINREYYQQCNTAREKCLEENFVAENLTQCPKGSLGCTSTISGKKYYCALGDGCPYPVVPQLYKCQFDKGRWCKANGFTQESSTPITRNEECIDAASGLQGRAEPCTENTDTPIYYYRCKLSCKQRALFGNNKGDLVRDTELAKSGIVAYYNTSGSAKHLYVAEGGVVPTNNMEHWSQIGSRIDFASINGIHALCDRSETNYMECCEERDSATGYTKRPTLKFDGAYIDAGNWFLNENMSDIKIELTSSTQGKEGFGETFYVDNATWNNVTIAQYVSPTSIKDVDNDEGKYHWIGGNRANVIAIRGGFTLKLTGLLYLDIGAGVYSVSGKHCSQTAADFYSGACPKLSYARFRLDNGAVAEFRGTTIISDRDTPSSWDGDDGAMLFYNAKMADSWSSIGDIWSNMNIGLSNSNLTISKLRIRGSTRGDLNRRFGGTSPNGDWFWNNGDQRLTRARGIHITNGSSVKLLRAGWIFNWAKIYVDSNSSLVAYEPIMLNNSEEVVVCLDYTTITVNGRTFGSNSYRSVLWGGYGHYRLLGQDSTKEALDTRGFDSGIWYYKYDKGNLNGQYPCSTGGKCDGKCNSDYDPNYNGGILCSGCYNASYYGLAY